ncbi:hypothetical protein [Micromonospora sp. NBRC 110037]|uniref:hypothetical protein n=1 Tax=Micromonospora sp. NBRC 110037 TaxID=1621261 RepID=UPI0012FC443E|nr:hypothetical protein [Micromonospora sp. NBRC 110037]
MTTELTMLSDELGADLIVRTATGYRLPLTDAQVDVKAVLRVLDGCEQGGARRRGARDGRRDQRGLRRFHAAGSPVDRAVHGPRD